MSLRMFRKLDFLRNLKGLLGAYLMRVRLISVFKLVSLSNINGIMTFKLIYLFTMI